MAASTSTLSFQKCSDCGCKFPLTRTDCPHCARPQIFPNVTLAKTPTEKSKLATRCLEAKAAATKKGCTDTNDDFESACASTKAVFSCALQRLHRATATGTQIYETYHDLERLRLRMSVDDELDWQKLRPQAEIELLGTHIHLDKIHYACLSLDGIGLSSYGECTVQLADNMIAHRATCFEGNTAVIFDKFHDFSAHLRCEWDDRHRICVAVFSDYIESSTDKAKYPAILLEVGARSEDDRFIEVHVFGSMTTKTFQSVHIDTRKHSKQDAVLLEAIVEKLAGVPVEIIK